jgi:linoleoyl-CoA desaturase
MKKRRFKIGIKSKFVSAKFLNCQTAVLSKTLIYMNSNEMKQTVRFQRDQMGFSKDLKSRVREYFKKNNISKYGNFNMYIKTATMLAIYFVPYFLMLFDVITNPWIVIGMWAVMGVGMSVIGLSVMHDACHNAYSRKKWVNSTIGYVINFVGGSKPNWQMQHNVLHHTYTNIDGLDQDIENGGLIRLSPNTEWSKAHKYQHIYAWFLYSLMTIMWATSKNYSELKDFVKLNVLATQNRTKKSLLAEISLTKIGYFAYILALPLIFMAPSWYVILIGFVLMHMISGIILAAIFQPAHVVETSEFNVAEEGRIDKSFEAHQLYNTANFATNAPVFSWFVGGLNFQIEHHLFPNICHVHYKKISKIVEETAKEYNLPYNVQPSFFRALVNHTKMLKLMGRKPKLA